MIRNNDNTEKILVNSKFVKNLNVTGDKLHCEAGLYVSLGRKYVIKKIGRQYKLNSTELILLEKSVSRYYDHLKKIIPNNVPKIFLTNTTCIHFTIIGIITLYCISFLIIVFAGISLFYILDIIIINSNYIIQIICF